MEATEGRLPVRRYDATAARREHARQACSAVAEGEEEPAVDAQHEVVRTLHLPEVTLRKTEVPMPPVARGEAYHLGRAIDRLPPGARISARESGGEPPCPAPDLETARPFERGSVQHPQDSAVCLVPPERERGDGERQLVDRRR